MKVNLHELISGMRIASGGFLLVAVVLGAIWLYIENSPMGGYQINNFQYWYEFFGKINAICSVFCFFVAQILNLLNRMRKR